MIRYTLIESGGIKNENDKIAHKSEQEIISTMKKIVYEYCPAVTIFCLYSNTFS